MVTSLGTFAACHHKDLLFNIRTLLGSETPGRIRPAALAVVHLGKIAAGRIP